MTQPADNRRVGLKDIADKLGVSRMTVSRAVRGTSYVESTLKERILEEARRQGYTNNPVVSQIMGALRHSQKPEYRETIAVLVLADRSHFSQVVVSGIRSVAEHLSYRVDLISQSKDRLRGRSITKMLRARGIRGVVVLPPLAETSHPHVTLEWKHFSTVLIGSSLANHGLARVQSDHYGGGKFLLRKLQHVGYRRMGLVLRKSFHERTNRQFQAAFHTWHPRRQEAESFIYYFDSEPELQACRKWIKACRPDCLVGHTPWLRKLAGETQYELPPACGLASIAVGEDRVFTGIQTDQMYFEIGAEAMHCLDGQLRNGFIGLQPRPLTLMIPPDWQEGVTALGLTSPPDLPSILATPEVDALGTTSNIVSPLKLP